jgi:hypothetical protein
MCSMAPKRKATNKDRPLSLYGLDPRLVLRRVLNTPPPAKKNKKPKKRK